MTQGPNSRQDHATQGVIIPAGVDIPPGVSMADGGHGVSAAEAYTALHSAVLKAAVAVGEANVDVFDRLLQLITGRIVFVVGQPAAGNRCSFSPETWQKDADFLAEIHVSVDAKLGTSPAVRAHVVFRDLLHQLAHAQNWLAGVRDRSRDERYHSAKFARTAVVLGLEVEADQYVGHRAIGVRPLALEYYAPQLRALESALVLSWSPKSESDSPGGVSTEAVDGADGQLASGRNRTKYVFASCNCVDGRRNRRTIRVATGWWVFGPIACKVCGAEFAVSSRDSVNSPAPSRRVTVARSRSSQLELPMTSP